jgi:c-di-GMP-binding flagellar brake protein YcgR
LLLREGFVIDSANQLDQLLDKGLYRPQDNKGPDPVVGEQTVHPPNSENLSTGKHAVIDESMSTSFAESGLSPGTAIQLGTAHSPADRQYVRLIGFLEKKSLIMSHPDKDGHLVFVKDGTSFECKAFHGKRVFHFHASALRSQMQPYSYLHLTYPEKVSSMVVRGSHRISTNIIAAIAFANSANSVPCTIRDLGLSGMQIHMSRMAGEMGAGLLVAFRLTIDGEKHLFEIPAFVRRARPFVSESGFESLELGVQFTDLPAEKSRLLEIYIYRNLLAITETK